MTQTENLPPDDNRDLDLPSLLGKTVRESVATFFAPLTSLSHAIFSAKNDSSDKGAAKDSTRQDA